MPLAPRLLPAALVLALPGTALAHAGDGADAHGSALLLGLLHPFGGFDHLLAMIAVGLWASIIGSRAVLAMPAAFLAAMAFGGVLGAEGHAPLPAEPMILASLIAIGAAVGAAWRPPLLLSLAAMLAFGLAHGLAHGSEGPGTGLVPYGVGFILSTGLLHAIGIALSGLGRVGSPRLLGAGTAAAGVALVFL